MEHFSIVLALGRAALEHPNSAVMNHIKRLIKALEKSGELEQAETLRKLTERNTKIVEMQPSRITLSSSTLGGEVLTPSVKAPVDKETSAVLAEIVHPHENQHVKPIFEQDLLYSIDNLLEEWQGVDKLKLNGIDPALSLMLFGEPGTGKTLLAHHVSKTLGYPLIIAKLDGLLSSFLGTTARNIANLFAFANRYKCILLLDEFDAIAKLRDDPNELGELKRVVNTLLQCLDERSKIGFTIAITNHENLLDPAIWRRFDIRVNVPKPSMIARETIISNHFKDTIKITDVQLEFLVWLTKGYSGSDIEKLANFLKRKAALLGNKFEFFLSIKEYIRFSAKPSDMGQYREKLLDKPEELMIELSNDNELKMSQARLAQLFGKTQSTISRVVSKR
ncbi:ATP-binding protein [Acinetobacter baumannii]|uniref:AAA family ATPase n=2 Tax=Acinetobacter baumannii TaxID=470 RepID=UPI0002BB53CF|nr:ATP-binding protein [Acinetobacter baumannii]EHZ7972453.1 ATP-binding protein [Acinetobacter baumannii]EIO2227075.1 ATP-binding protein [Acinetobacter baumannii]EKU0974073.1 ATP-binding protein [Acinetobacter baumannii]EKU4297007.1 ATP-binding protein [Acinetobacter baumannii]EKU4351743.1 ATP-binding protein [Acinetobacter baumannii]